MTHWFWDKQLSAVIYYESSIGESWWFNECIGIVKNGNRFK
jgi:hypothetical protein